MDPNDQWKAPRELARSTPREVRLTGQGMALAVLGLLFVAGALAIAAFLGAKSSRETADRRILDEQGIRGQAVINRVWRGADKEHPPMVSYEFTMNGSVYRHTTRAPMKVWQTLAPGQTIAIRYLPSRPQNNTPDDWEGDGPLPRWLPPMLSGMLLIPALVLPWIIRSQRRLLSEGRVAMGIVKKSRRSKDGRVYSYDFTLPEGRVVSGRTHSKRLKLEPGAAITVIYDPEKPRRNALYPLDLVRIDDLS